MITKHRSFFCLAAILVVLSGLVLSVSAAPTTELDKATESSPNNPNEYAITLSNSDPEDPHITDFFKTHTRRIDDKYYFNQQFTRTTFDEYVDALCYYLIENPGSIITINLEGRGIFSNNERIATSDGKQIFINCSLVNKLTPLINKNYIKWIGVEDKGGKWKYVIYGSLRTTPSPYFLNFAENNTFEENGYYYLDHQFDQNTLFDYIEAQIDHLADYRAYSWIHDPTILLNLKGYGLVNNNVIVAGVTDIANFKDAFIYDIGSLRASPERYKAGSCIVRFLPNDKVAYVDMKAINELLPEIGHRPFEWLGFQEGLYFDSDVVWGWIRRAETGSKVSQGKTTAIPLISSTHF
jgi:hypothetical protein